LGLRVTGGLTFGPKPGAVDKGCLDFCEVNLDPINDTYMLRVNIDGKKSMSQFSYAKPENKVIAHKNPTK